MLAGASELCLLALLDEKSAPHGEQQRGYVDSVHHLVDHAIEIFDGVELDKDVLGRVESLFSRLLSAAGEGKMSQLPVPRWFWSRLPE